MLVTLSRKEVKRVILGFLGVLEGFCEIEIVGNGVGHLILENNPYRIKIY